MPTLVTVLLTLLLAAVGSAQSGETPPPAGKPKTEQGEAKPKTGEQGQPEKGKPEQGKPDKPGDAKGTDPKGKGGAETGEGEDDEDIPPAQLPSSADPADIAAMQSAQAMLRAEARLRKLLKAGKIEGIDKILTFEELSNWTYQDGLKGMPTAVKEMDGKHVMMTGFMLPIDEVQNIKQFLLVQSLWSCCYGQPPDINGIVRVVMKGDKRIDYKCDPIKVIGDFKVEAAYEDGYCLDIYQLHADSVEVLK